MCLLRIAAKEREDAERRASGIPPYAVGGRPYPIGRSLLEEGVESRLSCTLNAVPGTLKGLEPGTLCLKGRVGEIPRIVHYRLRAFSDKAFRVSRVSTSVREYPSFSTGLATDLPATTPLAPLVHACHI